MLESSDYNLDTLLMDAVNSNATDVHICTGAPPKMRVYGELKPMAYKKYAQAVVLPVLNDIKSESLLKPLMDALARSRYESSGNWDMSYNIGNDARFRVNIFRQKGAIAGVFRILPTRILRAEKLGLPSEFFDLSKSRRGMILVTGTTGSGKSTTLSAFVDIINRKMPKHIITLEEPIEYEHWHEKANISQREVGSDVSSFEEGLRAALREDPDVILVGEMRDRETIDIALKSAETGHLLLSTLHTMGAVETVNRIVDVFPESSHNQIRNQFASVVKAVVSQQLMPRADDKGYAVAFEILYRTKEVQRLIRANNIEGLEDYLRSEEAHKLGMQTMDESIIHLLTKGTITKETAFEYAVDKQGMEETLSSLGLFSR